jgi:hypothetical protein
VKFVNGRAQEANVDLSADKSVHLSTREKVLALDFDSGKLLRVLDEHTADPLSQAEADPDGHQAGFAFLGQANALGNAVRLSHEHVYFAQELTTHVGQSHLPTIAHKELRVELVLKLTDLAAQGGDRDFQLLCSL